MAEVLLSNRLIKALTQKGLLPDYTVALTIRAVMGEPILLTYESYGCADLLEVVPDIEETEDVAEAIVR